MKSRVSQVGWVEREWNPTQAVLWCLLNSHKTEYVARVVYPPHYADHKGSALHFSKS